MDAKPLQRIGKGGVQIPSFPCEFPLKRVHMSHPGSLANHPEHPEFVLGYRSGGARVDRTPNGTYITVMNDEIRIVTRSTYIPLAFFASTSMTSCLSVAFHLCISRSLSTKD